MTIYTLSKKTIIIVTNAILLQQNFLKMTYPELGELLKKERGSTPRDVFAQQVGVHSNTIYKIENGIKVKDESVERVFNALGYSFSSEKNYQVKKR